MTVQILVKLIILMQSIRRTNINNLEQYRVFHTVAIEGGFSKAAEKLFVSQSAVSQSIRQLEDNSGVKLFIRLPRSIKLTKEGEMLFEYIDPALNKIKAGEKRLMDMAELKSGGVTVSSSDTFCMYLFPSLLEKFSKSHPGISMNIANKTSSETKELLENGEADIGIINLYGKNYENLKIWKSYTINDCFIIRKGTLGDNSKKRSIAQVAELNHIMLEKGTSTRAHIDKYFADYGIEIEAGIELGSVELLLKFAAMGMGVSCIAREFLEKSAYSDKVDIVPVKTSVKQRSIGVVTLKGVPVSKAAEAFLRIIMEEE